MMLKALIFDVDGTIAETERDGHRVAFNMAFESLNLPWRWDVDTYGQLLEIGGGKERLLYYLKHFLPHFCPEEPLEAFIARLHRDKSKYFAQLLQGDKIPLRIGIKRLLTEASEKGIRLAIASTAAEENVKALLYSHFGENHPFEVIAAGDMVKKKKPAPDIYLLALEKLNLKPENCLTIEDTNQGLTASKKAGLKTVITINDYSKNQDFQEANLVLNHLGESDLNFNVIKGNSYQKSYFDIDLAGKILTN